MERSATGAVSIESQGFQDQVDSFLVEALENPRHRLTVLRMEFDIQRFMQNSEQHQFEFQHLPTSYLRCAAHRVAQHYGLLTTGIDNTTVGLSSRVIARKTPNNKFPLVRLSEIPVKQTEKETSGKFKIVLRPRSTKASSNDIHFGHKKDAVKSMEERKEEYDRARARIFNGSNSWTWMHHQLLHLTAMSKNCCWRKLKGFTAKMDHTELPFSEIGRRAGLIQTMTGVMKGMLEDPLQVREACKQAILFSQLSYSTMQTLIITCQGTKVALALTSLTQQ